MIKDTIIILVVILVLMILIAVFGGCVRCNNNNYSREMYTTGVPVHDSANAVPMAPITPAAMADLTPQTATDVARPQTFREISGTTFGPSALADTAAALS